MSDELNKIDEICSNRFHSRNWAIHKYDPRCMCEHCVEHEEILRLYARHDEKREAGLRERFGIIPKELR